MKLSTPLRIAALSIACAQITSFAHASSPLCKVDRWDRHSATTFDETKVCETDPETVALITNSARLFRRIKDAATSAAIPFEAYRPTGETVRERHVLVTTKNHLDSLLPAVERAQESLDVMNTTYETVKVWKEDAIPGFSAPEGRVVDTGSIMCALSAPINVAQFAKQIEPMGVQWGGAFNREMYDVFPGNDTIFQFSVNKGGDASFEVIQKMKSIKALDRCFVQFTEVK